MKVSVVIPTHNSAKTIEATLATVLAQTIPPDEVLILDDGSTDNTVSLLRSYEPRITILQQTNQGVSHARNTLCQQAAGDLIAFLDHDDLWHPRYLEAQRWLFESHPSAIAFFTGHVDFHGYGNHDWVNIPIDFPVGVELIAPLSFLQRYNQTTGLFGSMSFCCVPKRVLCEMGPEPFRVSGVDDSYLCSVLPLMGPVVYAPEPLVAYRLIPEAQSADRLRSFGLWVNVFEQLEERYGGVNDPNLRKAFRMAFASKRRQYGKILMALGQVTEARRQFRYSAKHPGSGKSAAKSLALWCLTFCPAAWQPSWRPSNRADEMAVQGTTKDKSLAASPGSR